MNTIIELDEQLIKEALALDKTKAIETIVSEALEEYIKRRKQLDILKLFNTIDYEQDTD